MGPRGEVPLVLQGLDHCPPQICRSSDNRIADCLRQSSLWMFCDYLLTGCHFEVSHCAHLASLMLDGAKGFA